MSVQEGKSQGGEGHERIEFLQVQLTRLKEQLKSETDYDEREKLETLIDDIHAEIEILQVTMIERTSATSEKVELRKSSQERKLTSKMYELKQQEASQKESKFITLYENWKEQVRATRTKLKDECSDQELSEMRDAVDGLETKVKDKYENIRSYSAPSTEIRRKMDLCTAVTKDLMGLMKVRMSEVGQEEFDAKAEKCKTLYGA